MPIPIWHWILSDLRCDFSFHFPYTPQPHFPHRLSAAPRMVHNCDPHPVPACILIFAPPALPEHELSSSTPPTQSQTGSRANPKQDPGPRSGLPLVVVVFCGMKNRTPPLIFHSREMRAGYCNNESVAETFVQM